MRAWIARATIALGVIAAIAATEAAAAKPPPGPKCAGAKMKAAGKKAGSKLKCHAKAVAKGTPVADCLTKAEAKFNGAFDKAEGNGGCATTNDAGTIEGSVDDFVASVVDALPDGGTAEGQKCAAAKIKAVGKKAASKLSCYAKAVEKSVTVNGDCLAKAGGKFAGAFAKAEGKGGCATVDDAEGLEHTVDDFVAAVVAALPPVASTTTTTPTTSTSTTTTTIAGVSFSGDVQPIFSARCALPGCHTGAFPASGQNLSAGQAYGSIVNVDSVECPTFKRVAPGSPGTSYLMFKLQGSGPCFMGTQMPQGGPALSATDQNTISTWISEGALNN